MGHVISSQGVSTDPKKIEAELAGTKPRKGSGQALGAAPQCEESFEALKSRLVSSPVLVYADFSRPFILEIDGRLVALRLSSLRRQTAVLVSSMKLEFLGLKWAMIEKFQEYLLGHKCIDFTDNNPLSYLQSSKLRPTEHRWAAQLASFDFDIKYQSGRSNRNADALSHQHVPGSHQLFESLLGTSVPISLRQDPPPALLNSAIQSMVSVLPSHSVADLCSLQEVDPLLKDVLLFWQRQSPPTSVERQQLPKSALVLFRQWGRLVEKDGVLFHKSFSSSFCLPPLSRRLGVSFITNMATRA